MTFSQSVKKTAMAAPDVAPMPPMEAGSNQSMIWITSIANSFICEYRGDTMRRLLAPLTVAIILPVATSIFDSSAAYSRGLDGTQSQPAQIHLAQLTEHTKALDATNEDPGEMSDSGDVVLQKEMTESGDLSPSTGHQHVTDLKDGAQFQDGDKFQDNDQFKEGALLQGVAKPGSETPLAATDEDDQHVGRFFRHLPPQMQNAIIQSRKNNRRGPMVVFRHWASERKPFVATFLFCLFFGLVGSAFFPKHLAVAQECCRNKFWRCLGKAILVAITLITTVRILDLIMIAQPLCTVLLAILELGVIAGLSVGVSLIGEGITRGKITDLHYFKTHPRFATFTKILIGSLILALIVQIPGAGLLPRFGIRIALLVAILGAGGLLKTKFGTQPMSKD